MAVARKHHAAVRQNDPAGRHFKACRVLLDQQNGGSLAPDFDEPLEHQFGEHGDRPSEGSSSIRSLGKFIIARPMASICCSPPESVPPAWRAPFGEAGEQLIDRGEGVRQLDRRPIGQKADDEIFLHGQMGKDAPSLGDVGNPRPRHLMRRQADQALAVGHDRAAARRNEPRDRAQNAGLAGAVGAEQHEHRVLLQGERHLAHGVVVAVGHAEIFHREKRCHRSALCLVPR